VNRSKVAWLLSLPLSAAGMLLAHQFAWELGGHEHAGEAAHGYLQYGAIFAALGVATLIVAATSQLIRGVAGAGVAHAPSARVFAIVPIIGFLLQEHLEHIVAERELEVTFFLTAPFLLGLALQVPFALAALFVARLILGLVANVVRACSSRSSPSWFLARPSPRALPAAHLLASADQNESAGRPCGRPGVRMEG
jgi:hypothetical protein